MEKRLFNDKINDMFSEFSVEDIKMLYSELLNFYLKYRDSLGLPSSITFGIEIEYEYLLKHIVDNYIGKELKGWISKTVASLVCGGEITSPVMRDEKNRWNELQKICSYLRNRQAVTNLRAGGHVHIGAKILDDHIEAWKTFLKLYICYEHVLFRFGYGDKLESRKNLKEYAKPVSMNLFNQLEYIECSKKLEHLHYALESKGHYDAISFKHIVFNESYSYRFHTIEFRFPNASTNEIIWQNNINVFTKMILMSLNGTINKEFLDYKLQQIKSIGENKYRYDLIYVEDALEFADLVFDNNLDKMYFLRQYFKNFEVDLGKNYAKSIKKFTL